jgi:PmbA protein
VREIIEKAMARGASSCELFHLSTLETTVEYEAKRLKSVQNTEERGAALRVIKDGRFGFATSTKLDDPGELAEDAIATAAYGDEAAFGFAGEATLPEVPIYDEKVAELGVEGMMTRAEDGIARILDYDGEINAESSSQKTIQKVSVLTSEGLEASFERTLYKFYLGGRLVEGTNFLDCSSYYGGSALDVDGSHLVENVIRDFKRGRKNADVTSGSTKVLFTPQAVADIMMTLQAAVDGAIVERGISPLGDRLGQTIYDSRITIYDDGLAKDGYDTARFDDEGVPMQRTPVIENGVLSSFLTDLRTSRKLDLPRTGNGLRAKRLILTKDLGKIPAPEITNWEMAGGDRPHEELVAEMGAGVIVDSIMGILMSNLIAGDFSGNVAYGLKVERGKIQGRVKDTMVAGNIHRLLRESVIALSSDVERVGQHGFVGSHKYPYLLLDNVAISTKA